MPKEPGNPTPEPSSGDKNEVEALLAACIEAMERGEADPTARICATRPDLLTRVQRRLAQLAARGLIPDAEQQPPETIGSYRVVRSLGSGGMGTVYLAEQQEPKRRVAVKVIKLGMDTSEVLRRFDAERQALAWMDHPSIAQIFDAGTTADGRPFFVMEAVSGKPITTYCQQHRLSLEERLELFRQVCDGVQHAHLKGVIHRDLKPSNILVTDRQPEGRAVKIIDFGLAKATGPEANLRSQLTEQGRILGTPEYMSPEQVASAGLDLDTRTDVYSLGVLLYEMLTGSLPFESERLRRASTAELERILREEEPRVPSTRIPESAEAADRTARLSTTVLRRRLRGDLDWIVLRAMEKDRNRRYSTALALSEDIRRHLQNEPVDAGPPSAAYRIRKFVRRYRGPVVAASAFVVLLVAAVTVSTVLFFAADRQRQAAERHLSRFDLLKSAIDLREAKQAMSSIYPAVPSNIETMDRWLRESVQPLEQELPKLRLALAQLEADAGEPTLTTDRTDEFLRDTLQELIADLTAFVGDEGPVAQVREDLAWVERIEAQTIDAYRDRWEEARAAIKTSDDVVASAEYSGFDLLPQPGLIPLGMDPKSKLWEFLHLRSGVLRDVPPARDAETRALAFDGRWGIVFVLVPGGTFDMGAQRDDPNGRNYDDNSVSDERPLHAVALAPFFIGKHELTRGQWWVLKNGADDPSVNHPSNLPHLRLPACNISQTMSLELLQRFGLTLTTEAQWEYACRAGSTTPWHTGGDARTLEGYENLGDRTRYIAPPSMPWEDWLEDGFIKHAPVGSFLPNRFGLHDVHGNVWEICLDGWADYEQGVRAGDGLRENGHATKCVVRGGNYVLSAREGRSSKRVFAAPGTQYEMTGARAARPLR